MAQLSETQINNLSALLSAPSTSAAAFPDIRLTPFPSASSSIGSSTGKTDTPPNAAQASSEKADPLASLLIESDLRREVRENIAHQRNIGTYKGRRHAMGFVLFP